MDVKQEQDPIDLEEFIKTEPGFDASGTMDNERSDTFKYEHGDIFEFQPTEQFVYIDEIIECEMPKIEQRSDLPLSTEIENIKQDLENTSDFKMISDIKQEVSEYVIQPKTEIDVVMKDISDIKQEVGEYITQPKVESELLTSHCDLPPLKIENADYYLEHPCSSKSLKSATKVISKKKKRYSCPVCQKNFPSSKSRSTHIDGHFEKHYVACQFCGKIMKKIELFQHFFTHGVKNRTKIHKKDKPVRFSSEELKQNSIDVDIKKNTSEQHINNKPLKCLLPSKHLVQKNIVNDNLYEYNVQRHLIIHNGEKQFKCDICSKTFKGKYNLKHHLTVHSGKKPFKCYICSSEFLQNYRLQRHLLIHSGKIHYMTFDSKKCVLTS